MATLQSSSIIITSLRSSINGYLMVNEVPAAIRPYKLETEGPNGNAYAIMAYTINCMKAEDTNPMEIDLYLLACSGSSYEGLLEHSNNILKKLND